MKKNNYGILDLEDLPHRIRAMNSIITSVIEHSIESGRDLNTWTSLELERQMDALADDTQKIYDAMWKEQKEQRSKMETKL